MESKSFKLSRPITTHRGELSELILKPASARSFINHGSPYSVSRDEVVTPDWKATFGFVSDMTGVDSLILGDLAAEDVLPLFNTLLGMLIVRPQTGSKPSTP